MARAVAEASAHSSLLAVKFNPIVDCRAYTVHEDEAAQPVWGQRTRPSRGRATSCWTIYGRITTVAALAIVGRTTAYTQQPTAHQVDGQRDG